MARKRVHLRYIENPAARRASLRKRRQGLLKKVDELSVLCDVQGCVVVYGEGRDEPPVHWPADREEMEMVLGRFEAVPEMERRKRMVTRESYVKERIEKCKTQIKRLDCSIRELEMFHLLQLMCVDGKSHREFSTSELRRLRSFTDEKVKDLERKANFLIKDDAEAAPPATSFATGGFPGFDENFRQRVPSSQNSGGDLVTAITAFKFPAGNFEVGGSSGTATDPKGTTPIFPYGVGNAGNVGSHAINPYQWCGTVRGGDNFLGGDIGGLGSNVGQVGDIGDVVRGYVNVGANTGQPQGNVRAIYGLQGPMMIGGNIRGGNGYNVDAPPDPMMIGGNIRGGNGYHVDTPPENVPRAVMRSKDVEVSAMNDLNQGCGSIGSA